MISSAPTAALLDTLLDALLLQHDPARVRAMFYARLERKQRPKANSAQLAFVFPVKTAPPKPKQSDTARFVEVMQNFDAVLAEAKRRKRENAPARRKREAHELPESVQEIADVIGRERALYLIGCLPRSKPPSGGGREQVILHVPQLPRLKPSHRLVQILGWEEAAQLSRAFGGEVLKPGTCRDVYRRHRDDGILRAADDGIPVVMIAEWFSVSTRHVQNVLRENAQEEDIAENRNSRAT